MVSEDRCEKTLDWKVWFPILKELNSSSEIYNPIMSCVSLWAYWDISYLAIENIIFPLFVRREKLPFYFHYPKNALKMLYPSLKTHFLSFFSPFLLFPSPLSLSFPPCPLLHTAYTIHKHTSTQDEVPLLDLVSDICFGSRVYFEFLLFKRRNSWEKSCFETVALRRACQSKFNWEIES